ncbi:negative regulator of replication initiation SeqA [Mesocricetibacter intestinalis]|uniref:Negative modulator of initiation of replication n=1 Tax=Mesocricetibacter intestinalis TaxID=1521930 RepID=A0A4R6V765_9PAST|nr:replication initiation negative regulator SeqA [Mesocricetibacter intestinalis]TDQ56962.1 negative regulator of replication initiation SeqA [Mesocricetibacter intestinalis]
MKIIEVDEELYQYIAGKTQSIGESASDILRRLLNLPSSGVSSNSLDFNPEARAADAAAEEKRPEHSGDFSARGIAPAVSSPAKPAAKKQPQQAIQQTVTKLRAVLDSEAFRQETKAVVRFLSILTALYRTNPESFALATETESVQGRTRVYFARDEAVLLAAGNHTKPKQIPDTPYWVITNTNSGRKMIMLEGVMREMHLPESLIDEVRVYFVAA